MSDTMTMPKNQTIDLIEQMIKAANDKGREQGLTANETEKLNQLYHNLDKELEKEAIAKAGETRYGQRASRTQHRIKTSRPSSTHTIYDEMRAQEKLQKALIERKANGWKYDENEEVSRIAKAREVKAMKFEDRITLLQASGLSVSQTVKVIGKPMQIVNLSAKTGKVKVVGLKVMGGNGYIMIEGNDHNGMYRKFKMSIQDASKYTVDQEIKIVHPKLGLFYGTVCSEQTGVPTWIEPNSIK